MRKDAVYTLLLNITLFPGMRCSLSQDPRYLRFSAIENGVTTTYNLKVRFFPRFLRNIVLITSFARFLMQKLHPIFWKKSTPISPHKVTIDIDSKCLQMTLPKSSPMFLPYYTYIYFAFSFAIVFLLVLWPLASCITCSLLKVQYHSVDLS